MRIIVTFPDVGPNDRFNQEPILSAHQGQGDRVHTATLERCVSGIILNHMHFLSGCSEGEQTVSEPSAAPVGTTTSVTWDPVQGS